MLYILMCFYLNISEIISKHQSCSYVKATTNKIFLNKFLFCFFLYYFFIILYSRFPDNIYTFSLSFLLNSCFFISRVSIYVLLCMLSHLLPSLALSQLLAQQSELDDCSNLRRLQLSLLGNGFGCHGSTVLSLGMTADLCGEVSVRASHTAPH